MSVQVAPPAVSPEVVTPIKPSEALRLGRLLRPRRIEGGYWEGRDGACAVGAIAAGFGMAYGSQPEAEVRGPRAHCPICGPRHATDPGEFPIFLVSQLNDDHHWSDDQIVAWLQGLGL